MKAATAITVAPLNGMDRKNRRSISGSDRLLSARTSATSVTAERANSPRISGEAHPRPGPSMIA